GFLSFQKRAPPIVKSQACKTSKRCFTRRTPRKYMREGLLACKTPNLAWKTPKGRLKHPPGVKNASPWWCLGRLKRQPGVKNAGSNLYLLNDVVYGVENISSTF
ncbi:hypothetical protein PIB30_100665, partial [Stylosanthes scabra]|nr:hypothetical protein [Stylosanthes scabra]